MIATLFLLYELLCTNDLSKHNYFKIFYLDFFDASEINECEPNLCLNGATCVDGHADFDCLCAEGYYGLLCESCR